MSKWKAVLPEQGQSINNAEIVTIGTELLLGQTLNTNARDLALELSELGISCYHQVVVGDNFDRLKDVLLHALERSDLVLATGGLGPTEDDITMAVVADILGEELVFHAEAKEIVERYFISRGKEPNPNSWKQTMFPEKAKVLNNPVGTAPAALIALKREERTVYLAVLPGPPAELNEIFATEIKPWLRQRSKQHLYHLYIRTIGIGESLLVAKISDLIHDQGEISIAPYASTGEAMLRLSYLAARDLSQEEQREKFSPLLEEIKKRVGEYIYSLDNKNLAQVAYALLLEQKASLAVAESCTAGLLAAEITKISGASKVFKGGIVSYANEIKERMLQIPAELLQEKGAVSEEVALKMAAAARREFASDYALSITGIAGPEGGSKEKPVGTVWIGISAANGSLAQRFLFGGGREQIRKLAVLSAFDILRRRLISDNLIGT